MIDLTARRTRFRNGILAAAEAMVNAKLAQLSTSFAAQKDGVVRSDQHRVLNFQGPGVVVTDDQLGRRTNVFIAGAPSSGSTSQFASAAANERVYDNGTSSSGPANWQLGSFNHAAAGWSNSIGDTSADTLWFAPPSGAHYVVQTLGNMPADERVLFYRSITLPSGSITSITLQVIADNFVEGVWFNGAAVPGLAPTLQDTIQTITVPVSYLTPGQANDIAFQTKNLSAGGATPGSVRLAYLLTIGFASAGANAIVQLAHVRQTVDNTLTSTTQWTDWPNLALSISASAGDTLLVEIMGIVSPPNASTFFGIHINGTVFRIGSVQGGGQYAVTGLASAVVSTSGAQTVKFVYYLTSGTLQCRPTTFEGMGMKVTEHT